MVYKKNKNQTGVQIAVSHSMMRLSAGTLYGI